MTEEALQQMVREHPEDAATWLVYADWLEQAGFSQRAEVVRLTRKLAGATRHPSRLAAARAVLDRSKGLKRTWLEVLNMVPLEGSTWGARDADDGIYLIGFAPGGVLQFAQGNPGDDSDSTIGSGTWMQIDDAVTFSIAHHRKRNEDYSRHDGYILGTTMAGIGSDVDGNTWNWKLARISLALVVTGGFPDLPRSPKDKPTDTEVLLPRRRWK